MRQNVFLLFNGHRKHEVWQRRMNVNVFQKYHLFIGCNVFVFSIKVMWKVNNSKMHGLSEIGPNVPAFLIKLWKLVNSPETDELICWSESGMSFIIDNPAQFSRELLSLYYKHNNMASFIRQLNMYGFHKIVSEGGGLKSDNSKNKYKDCMEFAHQCFIKDHPYLLENIKRKLPNPKSGIISNEQLNSSNLKNGTQSEILAKVLSDVNNLKGKQESWDAKLASMKRENEALWRELAIFRQKHLKQEQIINRLIHFIVTIVQPSRNVPLRRRYPLMLNDIQPVKKITKLSGADTSQFSQGSPSGPTIHEIDTSDVLLGSPEQLEVPSSDVEFISSDFVSSPKFVEIESPEISTPPQEKKPKIKPSIEDADNIPEDWLEIQLTEGNQIDPLTPIDPAKINPAVAAATLKHLGGTGKQVSPISVTLPAVTIATDSGKKNLTEKKVIYLTGINDTDKMGKKNTGKRPIVLKLDIPNKKGNSKGNVNEASSSSLDLKLDLVPKNGESSGKVVARPVAGKAMKRKASCLSPTAPSSTPKAMQAPKKILKKADSKSCEPELEIDDDLDFLLSSKKDDDDLAESGDSEKTSSDSFLKLQSLYDGTISEENLDVSPPDISTDLDMNKEESEIVESIVESLPSPEFEEGRDESTTEEKTEKTADEMLNFDPESMVVVCQNSNSTDGLTRDLSTHVESVQGEIDYLKEMLKGEGYNFDANTLPWLFTDDPLSYGVLPPADEEDNEKKNEEAGVSGNELMTYGSPNLMDLVDMIGSSSSNQDWSNVLSPSASVVTDLATPSPSPSAFGFPSPNKRRKS